MVGIGVEIVKRAVNVYMYISIYIYIYMHIPNDERSGWYKKNRKTGTSGLGEFH